ncbi:Cyanovirin-N [Rhodofomes roseus]|uniref:Cyanovirin-N n=1 Tax=Rhodofomes roseus TaxID=34475 RepID=A0ABQ8K639_9APHY|nr:Cyanovirin-N [Rhodofomes roseus]KAH9832471.1 Cyanovirin-N [Rhodofomes roseus]
MVFTLTTYDAFLKDNHILVAYCYSKDGSSRRCELDLDKHLGNNDGWFDTTTPDRSHAFSHSSRDITYKDGTLRASLRKLSKDYNITTICLDSYVVNANGQLQFCKTPGGEILSSCRAFCLTDSVLSALCLGMDHTWHASSIDLNGHYGVYKGAVVPIGTHFHRDVRNACFQVRGARALLCAEVRVALGKFEHGEVDLSNCVFNREGRLTFVLDLSGGKPFKLD